ncbi:MAG: cadherin-like beta sandwich domain-containing protein, partial [Chromatiales bacterium]|nr:cadherin-like beta sandwich domain-containing protein [Chromatiales bacterium]
GGRVGGLVGSNGRNGSITNSYAMGAVTGQDEVGGLVGFNGGSITNSYAMGAVTGQDKVGGLVGYNDEDSITITNSYAMGTVTGQGGRVGGLVGSNFGSITNSYAMGAVTGQDKVGGLVGNNVGIGSITNSYATGDVRGQGSVGGLVGDNDGSIANSYATGDVTGGIHVGGLIGFRDGSIKNSSPQSTEALQSPTAATGIYSEWSTANWDFGNSLQYPVLKYTRGPDDNNPACGISGQPNCGALLPSFDANLSDLMVSAGILSQPFSSDIQDYTVMVANATRTIIVTPTARHPRATITVNKDAAASGRASGSIALAEGGTTTITVVVTAQDGTENTYTIAVSRPLSNDASLSALEVSAGILSPDFMSDIQSYTVSVANTITTITLTPTASDPDAGITVNGGSASSGIPLTAGEVTKITVVVTAQDGTTNTYTIAVSRPPSSDASLSDLTVSTGTLMPPFMRDTLDYTVEVANATTTITVTPTANHPSATIAVTTGTITVTPTATNADATITVEAAEVESGSASSGIALAAGEVTTITVVVTAQDGKTKEHYMIAVTRPPAVIRVRVKVFLEGPLR